MAKHKVRHSPERKEPTLTHTHTQQSQIDSAGSYFSVSVYTQDSLTITTHTAKRAKQ